MDRDELAAFLRTRRERIAPGNVVGRRRTPGLRREEVAERAVISVEYYTRLEQARAPRPSYQVLSGLAGALELTDAERDHLHHLAGTPPPPPPGPSREVRPSIAALIDRLPNAAAMVLSASFEVIAWNDLCAALLEDFGAIPREERNLVRRSFLGPHRGGRRLYGISDAAEEFARTSARDLRATAARYPNDPELKQLVDDLLAGSAEFAELWNSHDVEHRPTLCKTIDNPLVGPVTVNCDVLNVSDADQRVIIYTATPGSKAEEQFRALANRPAPAAARPATG